MLISMRKMEFLTMVDVSSYLCVMNPDVKRCFMCRAQKRNATLYLRRSWMALLSAS